MENEMKVNTQSILETILGFGWLLEGDRIAVKRSNAEEVSKGGIIIPETAKEKPIKGMIVALGNEITEDDQGLRKANCPFHAGQIIQFGKYAGSEVVGDNGKEYLVMRKSDIIAYKP